MENIVEYIPILTTIFAVYFVIEIYNHYKRRRTKYLLWWTIGVVTFGLGTLSESYNVLFGWGPINLKFWYIVGALLGGFPLAQGTVYLLMKKKFANISSIIMIALVFVASICIVLTPITLPEDFDFKLTGAVFEWKWVRLFSPIINLYAFVFLVGGAVYSAIKYYYKKDKQARFIGNIYIAFGALLPGIGGSFTRFGYVNALFVTEFIGLVLIYVGYKIIKENKTSLK